MTSGRLYDAFLTCGLDFASGVEENQLMSEHNNGHTPLHRFYKSKVLACFPENSAYVTINKDAVNTMCMPHGVHFVTAKRIPAPSIHTFIVTKEDGSKLYGSALTFFEPMVNHVVLAALLALQSIHVAELSNSISHVPTSAGGVTKSLPRHFKIGTMLSQGEVSQGYFDPTKDLLLVSKCIAVIGELPVVHAAKKILSDLLDYVCRSDKKSYSVESVIHNFLYKIPLPMPGQTVAFRTCRQEPVIVTRPGDDELPLLDYSLKELFSILSVDKVVTLLTCVLLEQQTLLQSSDCQKLMVVAECVTALLAPFSWPHVYVPILPASMEHFLDAPVPFIMGLMSTGKSLINQSNLCVVDLDNGKVDVPEDVPCFPNRGDAVEELSGVCRKYDLEVLSNASSTDSGSPQLSTRKHISWGSDSGISGDEGHASRQNVLEVLQNSEAFRTVSELARKAGVHVNMADLEQSLSQSQLSKQKKTVGNAELDRYIDDMRFNNEIRELMLNRFTMMFGSYENFVIQPSQNKESWISCQDSNHNFDKAAFLSDQPRQHLPFLSRFIESQMFTTFVDQKILIGFGETHLLVKLFDQRIQKYKCHHRDSVMIRMTTYDLTSAIEDLEKALEKRIATIDLIAPPISEILSEESLATSLSTGKSEGLGIRFPQLNAKILNKEPHRKRRSAGKRRGVAEETPELKPCARVDVTDLRTEMQLQPAGANWNFIEQLLKEVKVRTKRMLVAKLGAEAADLGHGDISLMGVEENTMIASLCDLFERIWSHGLQVKQGKSALWSHLLHYQDVVGSEEEPKVLNPNSLSPDLSTSETETKDSPRNGRVSSTPASPTHTLTRQQPSRSRAMYRSEGPSPMSGSNDGSRAQSPTRYSRRSSPERIGMRPLPDSLVYDMRSVQNMTDVKSHIGYARALVRLSLEKKMLSKHMRSLFSEPKLIRDLYKRHAFLRSDDEREQFIYHLLSLNAVDYYCFTHTFTNTVMPYRILIVPSRKFNASSTSASVWIRLSGTLGVSTELNVPKAQLEVVFKHKNLGLLTTLTIGHDNSGMAPRWLIDCVLARNEVTGHSYRFQCGRWLGLGVDDDSTERLLVAERLDAPCQDERGTENSCRSRSSSIGPSLGGSTTNLMSASFSGVTLPRRSDGYKGKSSASEIQEALGHAVNNIVKHFCKRECETLSPTALTPLLCGDAGLVFALELVFLFGFRSARLFGRKLFIWDYLVKFRDHYLARLSSSISSQPTGVRLALIDLIGRIESAGNALGKDGKFQVFVCLAFRDNLLCQFVKTLSASSVTHTLYEESSFLRDRRLATQLLQLLEPLTEFKVALEPILLRGLEK